MKKVLLSALTMGLCFSSFAQMSKKVGVDYKQKMSIPILSKDAIAAKGTADGDTIYGVLNFSSSQLSLDSLVNYQVGMDSGFIYGPNPFGDQAWGERFDFNGADSAVQVIGTFALFGGTVSSSSTHAINFKVWSQGAITPITGSNYSWSGFPSGVLTTSQNFPVTALGIGASSLTPFLFSSPTAFIADSFFVGYTANWTFPASNGDTIGILTTRDGYRYAPLYFLASNGDTILNVKNATQYSDNSWNDDFFSNFQLAHHLAIFPILVVNYTTSFKGITKNNLTFFGNYPNPATNRTNIKFALNKAENVTVTVTDMTGKVLRNIQQNYTSGEHTIAIETSELTAGNYLYVVRTAAGEGMGSKFTVVK